ncbi:unnamed protein product [Sphenostylis stenocarpa]|uniref:Uncharacterized protein n=1 Tax=Sphenostylis stenocarpa TaxID=92480 RepID=A0AA86SN66_9FABA|nr:unnamed protein product [Sphenostylis stenocarpa]
MEQTDPETLVKKDENPDEVVPELSLGNGGEVVKASHESLVTDVEWECKIIPKAGISASSSGWPPFDDIKSSSLTHSLSAKEQATVAVLQLQHKALEACQKFLAGNAGSDGDEGDDNNEDEDELIDNFDPKECEEYKFFEKVFAEDGELRSYYENNHREGDFYCLVCGGIGKKVWKRFKDCNALIHHSTSILRTTRKRAHRAYALVISKVVGCNIDQLPAIVLKDLDSSLEGSRKLLGFEKEGDNLDGKVSEPSSENGGEIVKESHESLVADARWVSENPNATFSSTASGWPSFKDIKSSSLTYSLSAEEQATAEVLQLQHKALESCQKFLVGDTGSDGDEDGKHDISSDSENEEEEEEEDELVDNHDSKECKEYKFFEKVFEEDYDLRKYYENNHRDGDFYCLVCGGIRKKVWKRFKDSIALIQHSTSILRTKRKRAHRAYAQVICKVVGWDIDQLPAIVLKDLDSTPKKLLVEPKKPAVGCIDDSNAEPDNSTDNRIDD